MVLVMRSKAVVQPDAPDDVRCPHCGAETWAVVSQGDEDVIVDVWPIETQRDLTGSLIRSTFCHEAVATMGGWRIHDPVYFNGCHDAEHSETAGWQWFGSLMSLSDADEHSQTIYSDHRYTCPATSLQAVMALATNTAVEGDAAGDRKKKADWRSRRTADATSYDTEQLPLL